MDLELTHAQRGARDVARRFAREKLEPQAGPDAAIVLNLPRTSGLPAEGPLYLISYSLAADS